MIDYTTIEKICKDSSRISESFLDDFLLYYCADREGLDKLFAKNLVPYRSIVLQLPEEWPGWLMSQYVSFRLFRKNGFASKYAKHAEIIKHSDEEKAFLEFQIEHPWRFSFCSIIGNPSKHFYDMIDVLTNEKFLLYSPGLTDVMQQHGSVSMLFYLIGFNGECWQTYGPHVYLKGIIPTDLLFFAQQLDSSIRFLNQIPDLIAIDPFPFMMLIKGSEIPLVYNKNDLVIWNWSEYSEEEFDIDLMDESFIVEKKYPLYKLSIKRWDKEPHFASCVYHAKKKVLLLSALTDRGYSKIIEIFLKLGYSFPSNPEHRVTILMLYLIKEILGKEIVVNPYEKAFSEPVSEEKSKELDKINAFLKLLLEAENAHEVVNIEQFASIAGIDLDSAHKIAEQVKMSINKTSKKK